MITCTDVRATTSTNTLESVHTMADTNHGVSFYRESTWSTEDLDPTRSKISDPSAPYPVPAEGVLTLPSCNVTGHADLGQRSRLRPTLCAIPLENVRRRYVRLATHTTTTSTVHETTQITEVTISNDRGSLTEVRLEYWLNQEESTQTHLA